MFDRFADCVLNSWAIALDKYTLHKSHLALDIQAFTLLVWAPTLPAASTT